MSIQAKLLSYLDSGDFRRVGETRIRRVRARIIAATNRDLAREIKTGGFRKDLFYRLAQVEANIPPLRERHEDLAAIVALRIQKLARRRKVTAPMLGSAAREYLFSRTWEGNIRELNETVETAFFRCVESNSETLRPEHFSPGHARLADAGTQTDAPAEARGSSLAELDTSIVRLGSLLSDLRTETGTNPTGRARADRPRKPSIFDDREGLLAILEETKCESSGRWNFSAAHRKLREAGKLKLSRPVFAEKVKRLFPDE